MKFSKEKYRIVEIIEREVTCSKCGNTFWTRQKPNKYGFISCGKCQGKFKIIKKNKGKEK